MRQRIFTLAGYFTRRLFFSLPGALYALLGLVFWTLFFDPRLGPPEIGYYILMNGTFGVLVAFLATLTIAGYANRAMHYPLLVRLHSRVEYLTAVLISALGSTAVYQIAMAVLSFRELPLEYGIYMAVTIFVLLLRRTTLQPMVSMSRYVLVLFPAFMLWGRWGRNPRVRRLIVYPCVALLLYLSGQFAMWGWVA